MCIIKSILVRIYAQCLNVRVSVIAAFKMQMDDMLKVYLSAYLQKEKQECFLASFHASGFFTSTKRFKSPENFNTCIFKWEGVILFYLYKATSQSPCRLKKTTHSCNTRPRTFPPPRCYTSFLRSQCNAVWNVMYLFSFLCVTVAGYLLSFNSLSVNNAGTMVVSTEKHDFRKYFQCWIPLLSNCEGATVYCMHFICYLWCIIL